MKTKQLPRELIRLAIEKKRIDDEMQALIDKVAPELDAYIRKKYRNDPEKLAAWEEDWKFIYPDEPPRRARRAERPKKDDEDKRQSETGDD